MRNLKIALFILMISAPMAAGNEELDKKTAYAAEQLRLEEGKLAQTIRGPGNAIFYLFDKQPELWYMDPLVRDRWMKNIEGLVVDGLYAARKARILIDGLNLNSKDADKLRNLERVGEYVNQLRLAHQGIVKNIATMKLPLAPRVARALGLCRNEEVADPNGLFLNLDQAEDRLQKLIEVRVNLLEHLLFSAPELFKACPTAEDIVDQCADLYLDPKVRCFAELKELATRTDMSHKNRCDAVSRVIGYHTVAANEVEGKIKQLEAAVPPHPKISKLIEDAAKRKK